jgi:lipid-A-disaccharide synthase
MPQPKPYRIFFSAGEPSGDLHGANLIRQLKSRCPNLEAVGYGGPKMAEAGCDLHADLTALAVMWFARALLNVHKFWGLVSRADRYFRHQRPDAVVLIDYPGFNWWIARRAKLHGIPVFYYTPPQIWAWATWRVKKMRKFVDHVLCSLPFEEDWLNKRGCNATFVGHPFFDEVQRYNLDQAFIAEHRRQNGPLVAILPGSRNQEVASNLKWFLKAAAIIRDRVPNVRFAMACFKPHQAEIARSQVEAAKLPIDVCVGKTPELMSLADCAMAVSGSVSLELLYHATPTVILYWISRSGYFVQKFFRKVKYITLVNLLSTDELYPADLSPYDPSQPDAERVLFPEYLTCEDKSQQLADHVIEWLLDPAKRSARVAQLKTLKEKVAHGGASGKGAQYILDVLASRHPPIPRPHFLPVNENVIPNPEPRTLNP